MFLSLSPSVLESKPRAFYTPGKHFATGLQLGFQPVLESSQVIAEAHIPED